MNEPLKTSNQQTDTLQFGGVRYWNASLDKLLSALGEQGGLLVVPAAPALCACESDSFYFEALQAADFAIIDSGYLAILMTLVRLKPVARISGLRLLEKLFSNDDPFHLKLKRVVWVTPSESESSRIEGFLIKRGFDADLQHYYVAPMYRTPGDFDDLPLRDLITSSSADAVILCIGGGKQEKLGYRLRQNMERPIPIFCTGAAISFLTGSQARIPTWADRLFLGWLFRVAHAPALYSGRYWSAVRLPLVLWRLRGAAKAPPSFASNALDKAGD